MGITSKYGESLTAAAGENTFCWSKEGSTWQTNFQKLPNVVNLAPILGAREFPEKIKTKNYKAQAGDGSKQQTSIQAQAHGFFISGWDPPTSV
jgi:hypothetical protein